METPEKYIETGITIVVWASPEEIEALRRIEIFISLMLIIAFRIPSKQEGEKKVVITSRLLHEHFPKFEELIIPDNEMYRQGEDGVCPAVHAYERAMGQAIPLQREYSLPLKLMNGNDHQKHLDEITTKAKILGIKNFNVFYNLACAQEMFPKIGVLT